MALLDPAREAIVIRVVYDGPPEAGKTTSLRALAGSLGQSITSPAEEYGRTLYFDWVDYTAGRFEGYPIRCQIVSVPGQPELHKRRWRLLKDADVVVFVGDSTRERVLDSLEYLSQLKRFLARMPGPPVGMIFQANKRDLPNALPIAELRGALHKTGGSTVGVLESVAPEGTGIRETFVFAVRLALDRVREQLKNKTLRVGVPKIDSSEALLESLRRREKKASRETAPRPASVQPAAAARPATAPPLLQQVLAENEDPALYATPWRDVSVAVADDERPWSPDPSAPSGSIWPPVEGRLILQEAAPRRMLTHRVRGGGWTAGLGVGWRIFSDADCVYPDLEEGRETLVRFARLHVACKDLLSQHRSVVLTATGHGTWRLWQIVRAEQPLRDQLNDIANCSNEEAATRILDAANCLCEMSARIEQGPCALPCTLDTVGYGAEGPVYVGLMPLGNYDRPNPDASYAIGSQLGSLVRDALQERHSQVLGLVAQSLFSGERAHSGRLLDEVLMQLAVQ